MCALLTESNLGELMTLIVLGIFNSNNSKCTQCESQGLDCVPPKTASLKLVSSVTENSSGSGFKRRKKQFSFGEDHRWIDVPKAECVHDIMSEKVLLTTVSSICQRY